MYSKTSSRWSTMAPSGWDASSTVPLKEWAHTDVGATVLRAMASSLTAGLAPYRRSPVGECRVRATGLVRGESFDDAWWKEFSWRVEKTAEILGPSIAEQVGNELKAAGAELKRRAQAEFPELPLDEAIRQISPGIEEFAEQLGIHDDIAAAAISLGKRLPLPSRERYDVETGKRIPLVSVRQALAIVGGGDSLRAAMAGSRTGGSVVRWMRSLP